VNQALDVGLTRILVRQVRAASRGGVAHPSRRA